MGAFTGGRRVSSRTLRFAVAVAAAVGMTAFSAGAPAAVGASTAPKTAGVAYFFVGSTDPRPFRITLGPDGNLWFTDTNVSKIGRITPNGVVTEFDIGEGKYPYDIVAGGDGNLWFTERSNNKIGAIDVDGNVVHEYAAPGIDPRPAGITVDQNDDVWFSEQGSGEDETNHVGKITPDGTVTAHQLYPCACFPTGITYGPDGNVWASEELGVYNGSVPGTIDRISATPFTITRFPLPQAQDQPGHLPGFVSPGPDGNVWFGEYAADLHQIGKITPDGSLTEYVLPVDFTSTGSLATGVDKRMWVTEPDADRVVVVSTGGVQQTEYRVHQEPTGIVVGPDGNMWFTNAMSGEIGRIHTAQPGVAYVVDIAPGFVPASRTARLGTSVEWVLEAPGMHAIRDASGLGLFRSPLRAPVSFFLHTFWSAGTYPYRDPATGDRGSIAVPVDAPRNATAGSPFTVTWATQAPPEGMSFDVQVRLDGGEWQPWQTNTTQTQGQYTPASPGSYSFRARLRKAGGTASTGWSPAATVSVT